MSKLIYFYFLFCSYLQACREHNRPQRAPKGSTCTDKYPTPGLKYLRRESVLLQWNIELSVQIQKLSTTSISSYRMAFSMSHSIHGGKHEMRQTGLFNCPMCLGLFSIPVHQRNTMFKHGHITYIEHKT